MDCKSFSLSLVVCLFTASSEAAFVLLEDFNSLTNGVVNGQHGWVGGGSLGYITGDPADSSNKVLGLTNTSANVYHGLGTLAISSQDSGTLFFRMRWAGAYANCYAGLSDAAAPTSSNNYEVNTRQDSASGQLKLRDANTYDTVETLQSNVWYDVWMVVNNPLNLYSVYLRGGAITNQVLVDGNTDGETWFTFRSATGDGFNANSGPQAKALATFLAKTTSGHAGPVFLDDIYVDPTSANLALPYSLGPDTNPPVILSVSPAPGSTPSSLSAIAVTFNETVTNVAASYLLLNGSPATNVIGAGANWTWLFSKAAPGTVTVTWAGDTAITDLATNQFVGTNSWTYTVVPPDTTAPVLTLVTPAPDATLSNLSQISVTFSKPVVGVDPDDLLVNDQPAVSLAQSANTYYFTLAPPSPGNLQVRFDPGHGITDLAGNAFDETAAGHRWNYTLVDATPPAVARVTPAPNATVTRLETVQILFSEPVAGVTADALRVNGVPATNVIGAGLGPYIFSFPQPPAGSVQFGWAESNGITDLSPLSNALAGTTWSNTLANPGQPGRAIINEFLTANIAAAGLRDEDGDLSDWIEISNPGDNAVNLAGWSLTDDAGDLEKWIFPDMTLAPGQYLVVFASGKNRRAVGGASRLHTSFTLSPYGDYLALCPPELPRVPATEFAPKYPGQRNDYSYGLNSSSQWSYYARPTPGARNGDSSITNTLGPVHSTVSRGLFSAPFTLVLVPPSPGATIRYTTDGSVPTESHGSDYSGPLLISGTTTLRVAAFLANHLPSLVQTYSYIFPASTLTQPADPPGFPITTLWNEYGWPSEYGVSPAVVNDPRYAHTLTNDLVAIPSLSIVMDVEDIFGAANGIYTHANSFGPAWERACSVEFIHPDATAGFQCEAGIQMHGGGSRARTQKHPFRIQFKGKYGPAKLAYQLFSDSPVQEFDGIDLRSEYNDHWTHGWDASQRSRGTLVRDAWFKDLQGAMGGLTAHANYVHLYINGLYWGVYNPCERPDAGFGASYLGGRKEDYDAFNGTGLQLVDGNTAAHNAMLAITGLQSLPQYEQMKQYLDVVQYADYMILQIYGANQDWGNAKNWYCLRQRAPGAGFKYLCWDDERILEGINQLPMGVSSSANLNTVSPDGLQAKLVASPEYRLLFADRVQKHFFNGGVLTTNALMASWQRRAAQVDRAIVAESARWGAMMTTAGQPGSASLSPVPYATYRVGLPYTRDDNWLGEQGRIFNSYFPGRAAAVLNQLRAAGLYPTNVMAPVFSQFGGRVARGFALTLSSANQIYFTTNGVDPRVYGSSAVSGFATPYVNGLSIVLNHSATIKARALQDTNNWSALVEAAFVVDQLGSPLRISELMYNPVGGSGYEFLELLNTGSDAIDLGGFSFEGITFIFPAGARLAGGSRLVLGNNGNPSAWALRYPGVTPSGWFGGNLSNSGERIALLDANGATVCSVTYNNTNGWPAQADGQGYSLELVDPQADLNDPANWRASASVGGTPGQTAGPAPAPLLLINELMANNGVIPNETTFPDWIELLNPTTNSIDLTGWSVTKNANPRQFVFTNGPTLAPGSFLVLWCDEATNTTPGLHSGFALSRTGESLFLYDPLTNRIDAVSFGPQLTNYSLGRVDGSWQLTVPTPGADNRPAATGAQTNVILNEWLANARPGGEDWVELFNPSTLPVALKNLFLATSNELFQLRSQSFVAPGGFVQLYADRNPGPNHLDFKLPTEGGAIGLYDGTGLLVDRVTYGSQAENVSQGRLPDGSVNIVTFPGSGSPGASNYLLAWNGPVLNEVLAAHNNAVTNANGRSADFVELYNPTPGEFDLSAFTLSSDFTKPGQWSFPPGTVLAPDGYLAVWFDNDQPATTNAELVLNAAQRLNGSGDAVYLFNPAGQVVDSIEFGFQVPGLSMGRSAGKWGLLSAPTPGQPNTPLVPLGSVSNLRINEWMASPTNGDDWVELFNADAAPVALGGLYLTDDPSIYGQTKFQMPGLSFIAPLGCVLWHADGHPSNGTDHLPFSLDALGEALRLYDGNLGVIDAVDFGLQQAGLSEGRLPDGSATFASFARPTPGKPNFVPVPPVLHQPQFLAEGVFRMVVEGDIGQTYVVEVSADLATWATQASVVCTNGWAQFDDGTSSTNSARFYRVRLK